ncbi:MAG: hypothetical protein AAFU64_00100 [Bacteroidota bacterium]
MRNTSHFFLLLSLILVQSLAFSQKPAREKSVRMIYLVSADREMNPRYKTAIALAARDIQGWYKKQLGGVTFRLNEPVVEVAYSDKNADYFYGHPNGENKKNWGYNNTFAEVQRLLGVRYNDPNYIWVIYSDGPGNNGMGGSGVCIMPEDDLLGLIGEHPSQKDVNRWIAGLGHEAGHAFGLPHPADTDKDADAIMWTGIYGGKYPDICYLTAQDKEILRKSPFFFDAEGNPVGGKLKESTRLYYQGGTFTRFQNQKTKEVIWIEATEGGAEFRFKERGVESGFYYLRDAGRNIDISLPIKGGVSYLSTDGGRNWGRFQDIHRE